MCSIPSSRNASHARAGGSERAAPSSQAPPERDPAGEHVRDLVRGVADARVAAVRGIVLAEEAVVDRRARGPVRPTSRRAARGSGPGPARSAGTRSTSSTTSGACAPFTVARIERAASAPTSAARARERLRRERAAPRHAEVDVVGEEEHVGAHVEHDRVVEDRDLGIRRRADVERRRRGEEEQRCRAAGRMTEDHVDCAPGRPLRAPQSFRGITMLRVLAFSVGVLLLSGYLTLKRTVEAGRRPRVPRRRRRSTTSSTA